MIRCRICGFDNVPDGRPCPSCGANQDPDAEQATIDGPFQRVSESSIDASNPIYNPGTMYAERYRIREFIGRGGMGSVYRVEDTVEKRDVALKILNSNIADEDTAERFKREIEILSRINHSSVPKIYGWGKAGAELYFVAEFIEGHDLKSEIRKQGPWPAPQAAMLAATVADCLAVAHAKGIVHRDVKPHNIMISGEKVYLLDFGVARAKGQDMATLTKTGMIVGTPEYMSPEQFSSHNVDERSDIYSLGVVLFELLTGKLPFDGQTPVAIAMKHMQEPSPPPRLIRSDIPVWIDRIVLRCLEKDLKKRYWSASELAADLRKLRTASKPRTRFIPGGDALIEDDSESSQWALIVAAPREKFGWSEGVALRYNDRLYQLQDVVQPGADGKTQRYQYRFIYWPEQEVVRRIIDYDQDLQKQPPPEKKSFWSKLLKKD